MGAHLTFDKYCKTIKEILGIKYLTEDRAKHIMSLYLKRTPAEEAAKQMKEK